MKSIKILSLILLLFCAPQLQVDSEAQITMKKCSVCGRPVSNCDYHGNHPKCSTCRKYKDQCPYKGNHPLCATCGELKEDCLYNGNHPKCSVCGHVKDQCPYKGNHPLCATCGELKDNCLYNGSHPKCSICGKVKEQCQYKGNHPKCSTCGKVKENCPYRGSHPVCSTCGKVKDQCEYKGNHPVIQKEIFTVKGVSFVMVKVEMLGGVSIEKHNSNVGLNIPVHEIKLETDYYYIGETEVTQKLWKAVMGSLPSELKPPYHSRGENLPVSCVNYHDCEKFIQKLNKLTGVNFRLPTEGEWEYAAKGGKYSHGYKYSGSNNIADVAWYGEELGCHEVKTKLPNELDIYDMSGNVYEWTSTMDGSDCVMRGGDWHDSAQSSTVTNRFVWTPTLRTGGIGFRLAL